MPVLIAGGGLASSVCDPTDLGRGVTGPGGGVTILGGGLTDISAV